MAELGVEPANVIYFDLFPCMVVKGDETQCTDSRVIMTDNHLYVIVDAPMGPELLIKEPATDYTQYSFGDYLVGDYKIYKQTSCSCGNRLRSIFPFLGVPYAPVK